MYEEAEGSEIFDFITTHDIRYGGDMGELQAITKLIMIELVKAGYADFLLLREPKVAAWWTHMVSAARREIDKQKEAIRLYNIKIAAYERLSVEDRKILGLKKPIKPRYLNTV